VLLELTVAEQRFNAVMEVLRDGLTVIEVADRSHRPRRCPHQMPATVEAHLCELRRRHPQWGQRRLAHELVRVGVDPPPGLTSIYRALVRNGLIQPKARRRRKASYRRWERGRPMELWQLDVMGGIWLVDGRELKAVTGIDDHSRFCIMAGLVERANARSVCRVFTQALARYGTPEEVLTDNGKVFTGRLRPHPAEVLFDRICRDHGITHRCTGIRCPTTTGKIERFHKTLRAELLTGRRFDSLAQATRGNRWLGEVLIECAWAAARSRDTCLSAQYWRLARRIGKKKAAVAVGHSILVIAWHLLANDCDYQDLGGDFFVRRDSDRARQRAVAQLQALGYRVVLEPAAA
jgi:transposase InsO family protein